MCGIVGLFTKNPALEQELGRLLSGMLIEMSDRGPDSAGLAVYRKPVKSGETKIVIYGERPNYDWQGLGQRMGGDLQTQAHCEVRATHAVMRIAVKSRAALDWLSAHASDLTVMSCGDTIEIFKEKGTPKDVVARFDADDLEGTHAVGHTRMATESAVTTTHSHPFSTGLDLCLVHNGSLSNHNRLRRKLKGEGVEFQTDNDSEVAAGYLSWRLSQGASIDEALEAAIADLDGFYTFAIGTRDGFAVLRDPIACKHAVLAETDDWVAMATEYRAIAGLPGADAAKIWEPSPGQIYSWSRA